MIWDRALIMQSGSIRASVTREELEADGKSLEQLFFDVTEGLSSEDMSSAESDSSDEQAAPQSGFFRRARK